MPILVEACVDTLDGALAAARAGASRLELCAALADGGTTPSAGLIEAVCGAVGIPVMVLVRARGGDFVYSAAELDVMRRDVAHALALGAAGVVIGALSPDGAVDAATTAALVDAAGDAPVTFHRAVDFTRDPVAAVRNVAELGIGTVLTSGGARTALEGAPVIARMAAAGGTALTVMAGGGINEGNVAQVLAGTRVRAIHVRCGVLRGHGEGDSCRVAPGPIGLRKALPDDEAAWEDSSEERIRSVVIAAGGAAS
jgi:copper homeostasis protein